MYAHHALDLVDPGKVRFQQCPLHIISTQSRPHSSTNAAYTRPLPVLPGRFDYFSWHSLLLHLCHHGTRHVMTSRLRHARCRHSADWSRLGDGGRSSSGSDRDLLLLPTGARLWGETGRVNGAWWSEYRTAECAIYIGTQLRSGARHVNVSRFCVCTMIIFAMTWHVNIILEAK